MATPSLLARRWRSFHDAFRGIGAMLRSEENARLHAIATFAVVALGLSVGLSRLEWLAITLSVGFVWSLEAANTAIEALCDVVSPERDPRIAKVKDVAAGAVLIAAITALGVAALVFGSRLLDAIRG